MKKAAIAALLTITALFFVLTVSAIERGNLLSSSVFGLLSVIASIAASQLFEELS